MKFSGSKAHTTEAEHDAVGRSAGDHFSKLPRLLQPALRAWRATVVRPALAALVVASVSFALPKEYKAEASFFPTSPQISGNLSSIAQTLGIGAMANTQGPDFYAALLTSRSVLSALASSSIPTDRGETARPVEFFGNDEYPGGRAVEETLRDLSKHLRVHSNKVTGVVNFDFSAGDSVFAAGTVNRLLALLNEFNVKTYQSSARATRTYLENRQQDLRQELAQAERALEEFRSSNRIIASAALQLQQARLERSVTLKEQVYISNAQQLEQAIAEEVRSTPTITVIDTAAVPARPDKPKPLLYGVLVGFLVGLWGLIMAYLPRNESREGADQTPQNTSSGATEIDLPGLAQLPRTSRERIGAPGR